MLDLRKQSGDEFMRERKTQSRWLLLGLALALVSLATVPAQAQQLGVIPGITGTTFNMTTGTGYITTPDGDSLEIWGYGSGGAIQYPGPTLIVNQGDTVTVNLSNTLAQASSLVFPGQGDDPTTPGDESVTSSGGVCPGTEGCLLTTEAPAAVGTASYTFTATHAGTYMYHSGTNSELQVEMGLFGAIIVRPTGFNQDSNRTAYGVPGTEYDAEYMILLSEMDPSVHEKAALGLYDQIDFTQYDPRLWFVNGRNAPDTLGDPNIPWMPHQPYNALPVIHPGEKLLSRFIGASHHLHPWHMHGNNLDVIARDGRVLTTSPEDRGALVGADLRRSANTLATAPLKTYDGIWDWTGSELGWDIYGTAADGLEHSCNGSLTDPSAGFDPVTHEYCPDHQKPLPLILPEFQDIAFGGFWSGSPFLGAYGDLPPGEGGLNLGGGLFHIWHSHSEKELINNDVFPGGMLTFCIVVPHGVLDFPTSYPLEAP